MSALEKGKEFGWAFFKNHREDVVKSQRRVGGIDCLRRRGGWGRSCENQIIEVINFSGQRLKAGGLGAGGASMKRLHPLQRL